MAHGFKSVIKFAACVLGGQLVQSLTLSDHWNPLDRLFHGDQSAASPNQVVTPDKRVEDLESHFLDAFVTVFDDQEDQSTATRFMDDCKGLKVELTKMGHISGAPQLMSRIESARLQVYKAQHLKTLFANGASPKGPNSVFVINETTTFQPPWNIPPSDLAEWYMNKVVALDGMCDRAILAGEGLDLMYHYARHFELAMVLVAQRGVMQKPDAKTALAKQTMNALIAHLKHLEVRLHNNGAVPGAYDKAMQAAAAAAATIDLEGEGGASALDEDSAALGTFDEEGTALGSADDEEPDEGSATAGPNFPPRDLKLQQ